MIKCPYCGRKLGPMPESGRLTAPEHLNYMKTERCPGSGKTYVLRSHLLNTSVEREYWPSESGMQPLRAASVHAAVLGLLMAQGKR